MSLIHVTFPYICRIKRDIEQILKELLLTNSTDDETTPDKDGNIIFILYFYEFLIDDFSLTFPGISKAFLKCQPSPTLNITPRGKAESGR